MFWNCNLWDHFGIFHWNKINFVCLFFFSSLFVQTESPLLGLQEEDRTPFPSSSFYFCGGQGTVEFRTGFNWANPVLRYFSQEERCISSEVCFCSPPHPRVFHFLRLVQSVSSSFECEVWAPKDPGWSHVASWKTPAPCWVAANREQSRNSREVANSRQRHWTNKTSIQVF